MTWVRAVCRSCRETRHWRPAAAAEVLQRCGMLKRSSADDPALLWELLSAAADRLACEACGRTGLTLAQLAPGDEEDADFADWPEARACRKCRRIIPPERLELFPAEQYCAACKQQLADRAPETEEDFCPRCGDRLQLRSITGRSAGYQLVCPSCRYR